MPLRQKLWPKHSRPNRKGGGSDPPQPALRSSPCMIDFFAAEFGVSTGVRLGLISLGEQRTAVTAGFDSPDADQTPARPPSLTSVVVARWSEWQLLQSSRIARRRSRS